MTNEEAIKTIKTAIAEVEWNYPMDYAVAFEAAVSALEKQIPKRPIKRRFIIGCKEAKPLNCCPTCKEIVSNECCDCGQRIDWSDETRDHEATNLAEETLTSEDFICSRCGATTNDMNALSTPIRRCFNCGAHIRRVRSDTE